VDKLRKNTKRYHKYEGLFYVSETILLLPFAQN